MDAIERIEKHAARDPSLIATDELVQVWVLHHLQIIGEAVRGLSSEFRERHPEVPWVDIVGMRNVVVHEYFGVDVGAVRTVVTRDLPELKEEVDRLLQDTPAEK